ncbi:MAG: outer membrane lipid asymmetry maintenance protein MlaD [Gammaproteobacteria bacterium]|nr:outer membrane lipid asymmetry maintenance protein MlaD [Gammaproteobacteria bacterium]
MMNSRSVEIWVGIFVTMGAAALFVLAMQVSNLNLTGEEDGYSIQASFENISGLKVRSPVTIGGVTIGRVTAIEYDTKAFEAVVTMEIQGHFNNLPEDSSASVYTAGLLGEKYIGIVPGGAEEPLVEGSKVMLTESSIVLEQLISQFIFSKGSGEGGGL